MYKYRNKIKTLLKYNKSNFNHDELMDILKFDNDEELIAFSNYIKEINISNIFKADCTIESINIDVEKCKEYVKIKKSIVKIIWTIIVPIVLVVVGNVITNIIIN